jgi:hypothetical protein
MLCVDVVGWRKEKAVATGTAGQSQARLPRLREPLYERLVQAP